MTRAGDGYRRILHWLRQHKLLHVLAVYAGASWVILEVTDVFIDKLGLPAWFFPAAILLLLVGLAVVVTTAIVETTPSGPASPGPPESARPAEATHAERLPALTWPRAIMGGVLAFGALALVGVALWALNRDEPAPTAMASADAIAVLPFRTTGAELEVWREGLMDLLSANLDEVGDLRAVDTRALLSRWRSSVGERDGTLDEALGVARELGARWAVHGQAVELAGQVRLDARLHAAESGEVVAASSVAGPPDSILARIEQLTLDLLQGLGEAERFGTGGRAFTTTSLTAVRAYLEGEQAFRYSNWDRAIAHFERALDTDSTFAMAAFRLGLMYGWRYRAGHPKAVAAMDRALRFADRLPTRDRELLEAHHLVELGRVEAIDRARGLAARYPDDPEAWYVLGEAAWHMGAAAGLPLEEYTAAFERAAALDSSFVPALIHPIQTAAIDGDVQRWDRFARWYLASDSTSDAGRGLLIAYRLVRGPTADSLAELDSLAERSDRELTWADNFLWGNPAWMEPLERVIYEQAAARRPAGARFSNLLFDAHNLEYWRGRPAAAAEALREAETLRPEAPIIDAVHLLDFAVGKRSPDRAAESVRRRSRPGAALPGPPWWWRHLLGWSYVTSGELESAAAQVDTLAIFSDSLSAAGDSIEAVVADGLAVGLRGQIAAARGAHREAVELLRRSIPMSSGFGYLVPAVNGLRFALANSLAELGAEVEALRILESMDGNPYYDAPAALARGQLYERRGEREKAIGAYARVATLWADCEPELRPTRDAADRALRRLLSES